MDRGERVWTWASHILRKHHPSGNWDLHEEKLLIFEAEISWVRAMGFAGAGEIAQALLHPEDHTS